MGEDTCLCARQREIDYLLSPPPPLLLASSLPSSLSFPSPLPGVCIHVLGDHIGLVRCLHLSDHRLVSAGDRRKINIWSVKVGRITTDHLACVCVCVCTTELLTAIALPLPTKYTSRLVNYFTPSIVSKL